MRLSISSTQLLNVGLAIVMSCSLVACAKNLRPIEKDLDTLEEESAAGDNNATHALCYRYKNGANAPLDDTLAFKWCQKAAESRNPKSMTLLADLYFDGRGVEQDYRAAARIYHFAAERGVSKAMFMLYRIYSGGLGVAVDKGEARYYLNRAIDRGYEAAEKEKQKLLITGG